MAHAAKNRLGAVFCFHEKEIVYYSLSHPNPLLYQERGQARIVIPSPKNRRRVG